MGTTATSNAFVIIAEAELLEPHIRTKNKDIPSLSVTLHVIAVNAVVQISTDTSLGKELLTGCYSPLD